jgi:hypothetical protein
MENIYLVLVFSFFLEPNNGTVQQRAHKKKIQAESLGLFSNRLESHTENN